MIDINSISVTSKVCQHVLVHIKWESWENGKQRGINDEREKEGKKKNNKRKKKETDECM